LAKVFHIITIVDLQRYLNRGDMGELMQSVRSSSGSGGSSYSARRAQKMKVYNVGESPWAPEEVCPKDGIDVSKV
jgi:hypothetical protein